MILNVINVQVAFIFHLSIIYVKHAIKQVARYVYKTVQINVLHVTRYILKTHPYKHVNCVINIYKDVVTVLTILYV
jgi:hypothetical protein